MALSCWENRADDQPPAWAGSGKGAEVQGLGHRTSMELPAHPWLTSSVLSPLGLPTLLHLHTPFPRKASELPRFEVCMLK